MKCAWISASLLAAFLASCESAPKELESDSVPAFEASADGGSDAQEKEGRSEAELERERGKLQAKLDIATSKLGIAQLEAEASSGRHEAKARHAAVEVELAAANLATFRESTLPSRLASAQLSLRRSTDRVQEAADELEQIKIMYDEADLEDMTAEFVVGRGKRNAEHAAASLEIQKSELAALEERELPQDQRRLELSLDKAEVALAAAQLEGDIAGKRTQISVQEAQNAITGIEQELVELEEEGQ